MSKIKAQADWAHAEGSLLQRWWLLLWVFMYQKRQSDPESLFGESTNSIHKVTHYLLKGLPLKIIRGIQYHCTNFVRRGILSTAVMPSFLDNCNFPQSSFSHCLHCNAFSCFETFCLWADSSDSLRINFKFLSSSLGLAICFVITWYGFSLIAVKTS